METIHLDDFLDEGLLRESSFRDKVDRIDWSKYSNKRVMIKGCTDIPIPTWAYLILTAQLAQYVERIPPNWLNMWNGYILENYVRQ